VNDLTRLAQLIQTRNQVAKDIASLIGRPATLGHVGEYIAAGIFHIVLEASAAQKGIDGRFTDGPLQGRSVNVKWYGKRKGLLTITPTFLPDYYLVLAGPKAPAGSSKGKVLPWVICSVHLFDAQALVGVLRQQGITIGIATSVRQRLWDEAEIYPAQRSTALVLSSEQLRLLALFKEAHPPGHVILRRDGT
jgi:hypothetical protein